MQHNTLHDMSAQISVRPPDDLRDALAASARRQRRRPSEIVRLALTAYLATDAGPGRTAADRVSDLLGSLESGVPDLAERHRTYVLEALRRGR